jgi:hypothetical protein
MATAIKAMVVLATMATMVGGCAGGKLVPMPLDEASAGAPRPAPEEVIVWVGHGQTERMEDGRWVRAPAFDYDFSVEQRRFGDHWESVKTMRRASPDYDGSAGPREQVLWFRIDYRARGGDVQGEVRSAIGAGEVATDREFRAAQIVLHPDVAAQAPFDTYRITQRYLYEDGRLEETVELLDHEDGREVPWVRNEEQAELFHATRLPGPPTRLEDAT